MKKKYICLGMCLLSMFCIQSEQIPQADYIPNENAAILSELPASQDADGSTRSKKCCCPPTNCCTGLQCSQIINLLSGCRSTPIKTPGTIINPGVYCLANDVTGDFIITANNVLFDLNGFTITGGISIPNTTALNDIVIQNGTLQNSTAAAIQITGPGALHKNISLLNLTIEFPVTSGISITGSSGVLISNVLVSRGGTADGDTGIRFINSNFITIENARINLFRDGINTNEDCSQVLINNSTASNCTRYGFIVNFPSCQVIGCIANNNTDSGFFTVAAGAGSGVIKDCIAQGNATHGMEINGSSNGVWEVIGCQSNGNTNRGFYLTGGVMGTPALIAIKDCQAARNGGNGFLINTFTSGSVEGCSAINNTTIGFNDVDAGVGNSTVRYVSNFATNNTPNYNTVVAPFFAFSSITAGISYFYNTFAP